MAGGKNDISYAPLLQDIVRRQGSLEDSNTEEYRKQQEKRKTKYKMGWLHKISFMHASSRAEQGCWGQDVVDSTCSESRQELEQMQWHVTHMQIHDRTSSVPMSFAWANGITSLHLREKKRKQLLFLVPDSLGWQVYMFLRKWYQWLVAPPTGLCVTFLSTERNIHIVVMQSYWMNNAYKIQSLHFLPQVSNSQRGAKAHEDFRFSYK